MYILFVNSYNVVVGSFGCTVSADEARFILEARLKDRAITAVLALRYPGAAFHDHIVARINRYLVDEECRVVISPKPH